MIKVHKNVNIAFNWVFFIHHSIKLEIHISGLECGQLQSNLIVCCSSFYIYYRVWLYTSLLVELTSKTPRQRPSLPITPASSSTSRIAVTEGSSSGSTPPPGTIQLSGRRDDVTSSTCPKIHVYTSLPYELSCSKCCTQHSSKAYLRFGIRSHAYTRRTASESLVVVNPNRIRLLLYHLCKHVNTNETNDHERKADIKYKENLSTKPNF